MTEATDHPTTSSRVRIAAFCERMLPPVLFVLLFSTAFLKVAASIALSLAILLFLVQRLLTRDPLAPGRIRSYYVVLLVFSGAMLLSFLNTQDTPAGIRLLRTTIWKLGIVVVIVETVRTADRARLLLWAYAAGCSVLALLTLYQGIVLHVWRPPTMWIAVHAGNLLMFGLTAMVSLLLFEATKGRRTFLLAMCLLTIAALYLNGTRGAWVAVAFMLLLLPMVIPRATVKQRLAVYALIVLGLMAASQAPFVREKFSEARINLELYRDGQARTSLGYRIDMWKASMELFREHPVIGAGVGDWQYEVQRLIREGRAPESIKDYNQTHNIFLDAFSTLGIVGGIALLALIAAPLLLARGGDGADAGLARAVAVLTTAAFVVSGMSDTLVHIRGVFTSYLMLIGIALALHAGQRVTRSAPGGTA